MKFFNKIVLPESESKSKSELVNFKIRIQLKSIRIRKSARAEQEWQERNLSERLEFENFLKIKQTIYVPHFGSLYMYQLWAKQSVKNILPYQFC